MQRVKVVLNSTEVPEEQAVFIKTFGSFNYHPSVLVTGSKSASNSNVAIFCYSKPSRDVPIACKVQWERLHNSQVFSIANASNFYHCSTKDLGCYIQCTVRPVEEGFSGECKIIYGPIVLDQETETKFQLAKKDDRFRVAVDGKSSDKKRNVNMVEVRGNRIRALDHNMELIEEVEMSPETMVVMAPNDPTKLKVLNHDQRELHLTVPSIIDKDLLVLLLEYRKHKPSESSKILEGSLLDAVNAEDSFAVLPKSATQPVPTHVSPYPANNPPKKVTFEPERASVVASRNFASNNVVLESASKKGQPFRPDDSQDLTTPVSLRRDLNYVRHRFDDQLVTPHKAGSKTEVRAPELEHKISNAFIPNNSLSFANPQKHTDVPSDHPLQNVSEKDIDALLEQYARKSRPAKTDSRSQAGDPETQQLRASIHRSIVGKDPFVHTASVNNDPQEPLKLPHDSFFKIPGEPQRASMISQRKVDNPLGSSRHRFPPPAEEMDHFGDDPVPQIPETASAMFRKKRATPGSQLVNNPDLFSQIDREIFQENQREKEKLEKERQGYLNEINKLRTANKSLLRENEYLTSIKKKEEAEKEAESKEMEVALFKESSRLNDQLRSSQVLVEGLREQLRQEQERSQTNEDTLFNLENENFGLKVSLQESERTASHLSQENAVLEKKLAVEEERLLTLSQRLEDMEQKLVKASLNGMEAEANERVVKELSQDKENLVGLVDQLKLEIQKSEEHLKVVTRNLKEKDGELLFLASALEDSNNRNAEQARLLEKQATTVADNRTSSLLVQKYESTLKRVQEAEKQRDEAEDARNQMQLELRKLELEVQSLRDKLDKQNLFKETLAFEKSRRQEIEKMTLANELSRIEEEKRDAESARKELGFKVDLLENEVAHLRGELTQAKETILLAGHENQELLNTLKADNATLRQSLAAKQEEYQGAFSKLLTLQRENQLLKSKAGAFDSVVPAEDRLQTEKLLSAVKVSNGVRAGTKSAKGMPNQMMLSMGDSGFHDFSHVEDGQGRDAHLIQLEEENQKLRDDVYNLREEKLSMMSAFREQRAAKGTDGGRGDSPQRVTELEAKIKDLEAKLAAKPTTQAADQAGISVRKQVVELLREFTGESAESLEKDTDEVLVGHLKSLALHLRDLRSDRQFHEEFAIEANKMIAAGEQRRAELEEKVEELEEQRAVLMDLVGKHAEH